MCAPMLLCTEAHLVHRKIPILQDAHSTPAVIFSSYQKFDPAKLSRKESGDGMICHSKYRKYYKREEKKTFYQQKSTDFRLFVYFFRNKYENIHTGIQQNEEHPLLLDPYAQAYITTRSDNNDKVRNALPYLLVVCNYFNHKSVFHGIYVYAIVLDQSSSFFQYTIYGTFPYVNSLACIFSPPFIQIV